MKRWFVSPIVGTGSSKDPFRSKFKDYGIDQSSVIASNPDGTPKLNWCLVKASAQDFTAVDADNTIAGFPGVSLDDVLGTFAAATVNKIETKLTSLGVDLTGITSQSTVRDLVLRTAALLCNNWSDASTNV